VAKTVFGESSEPREGGQPGKHIPALGSIRWALLWENIGERVLIKRNDLGMLERGTSRRGMEDCQCTDVESRKKRDNSLWRDGNVAAGVSLH